jgi:hypothetical protein
VVLSIVIGVVLVLLVVMKWADRRDRAKGHVNRGMGELMSTMRAERMNMRNLRRTGGAGAVSPHQFQNKRDRFRRR